MSDEVAASKGLGFPVLALARLGYMPANGEDEQEATRVFYVAATRATQRLRIEVGGDRGVGQGFMIRIMSASGTINSIFT